MTVTSFRQETFRRGKILIVPLPVPSTVLEIERLSRYLCLDRPPLYWCRPRVGTTDLTGIEQGQFLLWETESGSYGIALPLLDGDDRAYLVGHPGGVEVRLEGALADDPATERRALYLAEGDEPFSLIRTAMEDVSALLGTFRLREDKPVPEFVDLLGWCTWDAFYQDVNHDKVMEGLRSFREKGISLGYLILDDGWLDHSGEMLNRFEADATKFPRDLKGLVDEAKGEGHVRYFGLWHALPGYWCGVNADGPLGELGPIARNEGVIRPWNGEPNLLGRVVQDRVRPFLDAFHRHLKGQGIDFLKIDGQSSIEEFTRGQEGRVSAMSEWQGALQTSAKMHFGNGIIHCMCHGSDVAYHMETTLVFRNSDDFFPNRPLSHPTHLFENAMNALWTSHFGLPDWDMFQSGHEAGAYHAAARAISGGPVYVSDKPGTQNPDLIRRLVVRGDRILRCPQPAQMTRDSLFRNPTQEPVPLKIANRNGSIGVVGAFHCLHSGEKITATVTSADASVEGPVALYRFTTGEAAIADVASFDLGPLGWEIVTVSPFAAGWIAPLGLVDKLNGSAALLSFEADDNEARARFIDGGTVGFVLSEPPLRVTVNGQERGFSFKGNLLTVEVEQGAEADVEVLRAGGSR